MARARNIKPGFFESEALGQCEFGARLLFAALWTMADREGRLADRPMRIRAYAFTYDAVTAEQVDGWLCQLAAQELIDRYEVDGLKCISVCKFSKHQNPHTKEKPSELPGKPSASTMQAQCFQNSTDEKALDKHDAFLDSSREFSGLIPDSGFLIADVPKPAASQQSIRPPQQQKKPDFEPFDDGPDGAQLALEAVEKCSQFWPHIGNKTYAVSAWQRHAATDPSGPAAWCEKIVATARVHATAHAAKRAANPKCFVPTLERWVSDGDYTSPPPQVITPPSKFQASRYDDIPVFDLKAERERDARIKAEREAGMQ